MQPSTALLFSRWTPEDPYTFLNEAVVEADRTVGRVLPRNEAEHLLKEAAAQHLRYLASSAHLVVGLECIVGWECSRYAFTVLDAMQQPFTADALGDPKFPWRRAGEEDDDPAGLVHRFASEAKSFVDAMDEAGDGAEAILKRAAAAHLSYLAHTANTLSVIGCSDMAGIAEHAYRVLLAIQQPLSATFPEPYATTA